MNTVLSVILYVIISVFAAAAVYILFLVICALAVDTKKEYNKNSRFYRGVLGITTAVSLAIAGARTDVVGGERLPADGRFLFVCNHRSKFDPIVSWHVFRRYDLAFISKPENFKVPVFGKLIRRCCFMAIDREDTRKAFETVNRAVSLIKNDEVSVALYPEGTRNRDGEGLLPFHDGVFLIAQNARVPIVVATVTGTEKIAKNFPLRRTRIRIEITEVIPADEVCKTRRPELSARIRSDMERSLEKEC